MCMLEQQIYELRAHSLHGAPPGFRIGFGASAYRTGRRLGAHITHQGHSPGTPHPATQNQPTIHPTKPTQASMPLYLHMPRYTSVSCSVCVHRTITFPSGRRIMGGGFDRAPLSSCTPIKVCLITHTYIHTCFSRASILVI